MTWFERRLAVARVSDQIRQLCPWLPPHQTSMYATAFVNEELWQEGDPLD
jgi:hypothetical protein